MRIAVLSDVHANREATEAVLEAVAALSPDRIVLLGDIVGYGPDPEYAVETAARLVSDGAICVLGNHDEAAVTGRDKMTPNAREAIRWTRTRLSDAHIAFLAGLPLSNDELGCQMVHASADQPGRWTYVSNGDAALACLEASSANLIICGHTHRPALYYTLPGRKPVPFVPRPGIPAPLSRLHRHVVVAGAVGQPRDGNPAACFTWLDLEAATVTMQRVPYDSTETARKISATGLPAWLGMRLQLGR